jgi:hypothetical protein
VTSSASDEDAAVGEDASVDKDESMEAKSIASDTMLAELNVKSFPEPGFNDESEDMPMDLDSQLGSRGMDVTYSATAIPTAEEVLSAPPLPTVGVLPSRP